MGHLREPFEPEYYYHVYNHANGSDNIFREDDNCIFFLDKILIHICPITSIFAYCLMPNHFHLLLQIKEESKLNSIFKTEKIDDISGLISHRFGNLQNSYAKAFNKKYHRKGSLFNQSINRNTITSEEYLIQDLTYIHLNPVNHNFCLNPEDWKFSSFHSYIRNTSKLVSAPDELINIEDGLEWFDGLDNFLYYHRSRVYEKYVEKMELDY